jgi:hypothetical protein
MEMVKGDEGAISVCQASVEEIQALHRHVQARVPNQRLLNSRRDLATAEPSQTPAWNVHCMTENPLQYLAVVMGACLADLGNPPKRGWPFLPFSFTMMAEE